MVKTKVKANMSLNDQVAIITGGVHGIGRAIANEFASANAKIIIADKDEAGGQAFLAELKEANRHAEFIHCDISERLDVLNLMAATLEAFGRVDILVNAAAIKDNTPFLELAESQFDAVIGVNLKGAFMLGRAAAQQMVSQMEEGGAPCSILFISSIHTVLAEPKSVAYSVASGGIGQLTKAMAQALAPKGIRVNAIAANNILGPSLDRKGENQASHAEMLASHAEMIERVPLGRFGEPEEVAAIAAFLASSAASYITGQTIFADGGQLSVLSALKSGADDDESEK